MLVSEIYEKILNNFHKIIGTPVTQSINYSENMILPLPINNKTKSSSTARVCPWQVHRKVETDLASPTG